MFMGSILGFLLGAILLCLQCSLVRCEKIAKSDTTDQYKATKQSASGLGFLERLALNPPSFTHNETDERKNKADIINLGNFIEGVKVQQEYDPGEYYENYWFDPYWEYCNGDNSSADLSKNDPCVNGSYISPRYFLADYLTWYLPHDACKTISMPGTYETPDCPDWIESFLGKINKTRNVPNVLESEMSIATMNKSISDFRIIGDYLGVGFDVDPKCKENVNRVLGAASEFDKAASAAAVTLMALMPALLTLGNLFVPRSSEVFSTSFLVGIMSAMFSLGLPVKSISGVDSSQSVNADTFEIRARRDLIRLGEKPVSGKSGVEPSRHAAGRPARISDLQKWSNDAGDDDENITDEHIHSDCAFSQLRKCIHEGWKTRAHCWHVPSSLIAGLQIALFIVVVGPLFLSYGTPVLLFDCGNNWNSAWLIIAAGISAASRLLMWETGVHERVKAYALSPKSAQVFRRFVEVDSPGYSEKGYLFNSTESQLPPLYPPLLEKMSSDFEVFSSKIAFWKRNKKSSELGTVESVPFHLHVSGHKVKASLLNRTKHSWFLIQDTIVSHLRNPKTFFQGGLASNEPPAAARRWRPLIILMHLSTEGRNPIVTLSTGLVEGLVLILLTAFFGAQWGANLFILLYTTVILLVAVTIGRMLGLYYVMQSAKTWSLHVFETKDTDQIRGCLRIMCSMKDVLVTVNGAWFFEGHRLDQRDGWQELQRCYNAGHLDDMDSDAKDKCKHEYVSRSRPMSTLLPTSTESLNGEKSAAYPSDRKMSLESSKFSLVTVSAYNHGQDAAECRSERSFPKSIREYPRR